MKIFNKILFVSRGLINEESALKQAMTLLVDSQRNLQISIIYKALPKKLQEHRTVYETSLLNNIKLLVKNVADSLQIPDEILNTNISMDIEGTSMSTVHIVKRVLSENFDIVIKSAETNLDHKGFKSVDLSLLRQCPCPVWLCHPLKNDLKIKHIAVAIDPEGAEKSSTDLSLYLLQLSKVLSESYSAKLSIISCWDSFFDERMDDIGYLGLPQKQASEIIKDQEQTHLTALKALIDTSGITTDYSLQHLRGVAAQLIPQYIEDNNVDLLIMGTVNRTGIVGFIVGNTAENIMHKLSCSLLALKPHGFSSNIKAN